MTLAASAEQKTSLRTAHTLLSTCLTCCLLADATDASEQGQTDLRTASIQEP